MRMGRPLYRLFLGPLSLRRCSVLIAPQSDLLYWGDFARNAILHIIGFGLITATFLLVVLPFIPFGQLIARLLSSGQPIQRYSVNIVGSLLGLWLYSVVSFIGLPSVVWFGLPPADDSVPGAATAPSAGDGARPGHPDDRRVGVSEPARAGVLVSVPEARAHVPERRSRPVLSYISM